MVHIRFCPKQFRSWFQTRARRELQPSSPVRWRCGVRPSAAGVCLAWRNQWQASWRLQGCITCGAEVLFPVSERVVDTDGMASGRRCPGALGPLPQYNTAADRPCQPRPTPGFTIRVRRGCVLYSESAPIVFANNLISQHPLPPNRVSRPPRRLVKLIPPWPTKRHPARSLLASQR